MNVRQALSHVQRELRELLDRHIIPLRRILTTHGFFEVSSHIRCVHNRPFDRATREPRWAVAWRRGAVRRSGGAKKPPWTKPPRTCKIEGVQVMQGYGELDAVRVGRDTQPLCGLNVHQYGILLGPCDPSIMQQHRPPRNIILVVHQRRIAPRQQPNSIYRSSLPTIDSWKRDSNPNGGC